MQFFAVRCCPKRSFAVLCYLLCGPLRSFVVYSHTAKSLYNRQEVQVHVHSGQVVGWTDATNFKLAVATNTGRRTCSPLATNTDEQFLLI